MDKLRSQTYKPFFFSRCLLCLHSCFEYITFFRDLFLSILALIFIDLVLTAFYLYSFSRPAFLVFISPCLFILLICFCISFLGALPSCIASADCAFYLLLSIAPGKENIAGLWETTEVLQMHFSSQSVLCKYPN